MGLQVTLRPDPAQPDPGTVVWHQLSALLAALPEHVPAVPVLHSLGECADALGADEMLELAEAIDEAVRSAGVPALRLKWCDAVHGRRGDRIVLGALMELMHRTSALCGHVRCGDGAGLVDEAAVRIGVGAADPDRAPLGLFSVPCGTCVPHGVTLSPVGAFGDAVSRAGAGAWAHTMADAVADRSGLNIATGPGTPSFDLPERAAGLPHTASPVFRVWL